MIAFIAFPIAFLIADFFVSSFYASLLARFQARIERLEREVLNNLGGLCIG